MAKNILIVGAGLFGAVCAYELSRAGHACRVIDKRGHIGGNCYTRFNAEAQCHEHVYGAHIFHTNSERIWRYVNQFAQFNHYVNRVKVNHGGQIYSFPINLFTLYQVFGVTTPADAQRAIEQARLPIAQPANLEEYCLSLIGERLYRLFIEGYTAKQWNTHPRHLPAEIIKRIPLRFNFDDNYFNDRYQGIPIGGYTAIFEKMLAGIPVELGVDFTRDASYWLSRFDHVVYTGPMDAFFDYALGGLEYRSLRFETELIDMADYQGNAVVNYTESNVPWTRVIEHKHFDLCYAAPKTLVTREYPMDWTPGAPEFYPIGDEKNRILFQAYRQMAEDLRGKVHFGGRMGEYRYYDMHQVVGSALAFCQRFVAGG